MRWTIKWTIMSKTKSGKYISKLHKVTITLTWRALSFKGSSTLLHNALKNKHSLVKAYLTYFVSISRSAIGKTTCTMIWKSWDFIFFNFNLPFRDTNLFMLAEYPDGTLMSYKDPQKTLFSTLDKCSKLEAKNSFQHLYSSSFSL